MKALLWKESREILYKVLIGLGVCLFVAALRMHETFNWDFFNFVEDGDWPLTFGLIAGGLLGMDLLSGERGKGTLGFLLSRPLVRVQLLATKFVVGLAALVVLLVAALAVLYAIPLATDPTDTWATHEVAVANRVLQEVGFGTMLLIFLPLWMLPFAAAFLGSSLSDNPLKSLLLGLLSLVALMATLQAVSGHSAAFTAFRDHLFDVGFEGHLRIIRVAMEGELLALRFGFAVLFCIGAFAAAQAALRKLRVASLGWRQIAIACVVGPAFMWTVGLASSSRVPKLHPLASVPFPGTRVGSVAVANGYAYMAGEGLLTAVDLRDQHAITEVGRSAIRPLWTTRGLAVSGDLVYELGTEKALPVDSLVVVAFDVSDKSSPRRAGRYVLGSAPSGSGTGDFAAAGKTLFAIFTETGFPYKLLKIELDEAGFPNRHSEWGFSRSEDESWSHSGGAMVISRGSVNGLPSVEFAGRPLQTPQMQVAGNTVFLTDRDGTIIVRSENHLEPEKVAELPMESFNVFTRKRHAILDDNMLYAQKYWPAEAGVLDVSDPANPVEVGTMLTRVDGNSAVHDGHLLSTTGSGEITVSRLERESGTATKVAMLVPEERSSDHSTYSILVEGGLVVSASSRHLRVYQLPW